MASSKPSEQEYTDAMTRHGSPEWTADDARVQARWLDQHTENEPEAPVQRARGGKES